MTTVRASTPMFLMSRKIKAMGVKMVLSGEGSDEVFGGYLYFHKAPSPVRVFVGVCVCVHVCVFTHDAVQKRHARPALGCMREIQHINPSVCMHNSQEEFQSETVRKIQALHKYDCMRANKSTMAWGVEARVPFLDK